MGCPVTSLATITRAALIMAWEALTNARILPVPIVVWEEVK